MDTFDNNPTHNQKSELVRAGSWQDDEYPMGELYGSVWEDETEQFLDHLGVNPSSRILVYGRLPRNVLFKLQRRVGNRGNLVIMDERPFKLADLTFSHHELETERGEKIKLITPELLPQILAQEGLFTLVFSAWNFSLVADIPRLLRRLKTAIKPGSRIGVLELHYGGIRIFPETPQLVRFFDLVNRRRAEEGVDDTVIGKLPGAFLSSGFIFEQAWPYQKVEAPGSPGYRWVESLFMEEGKKLLHSHLITKEEWDEIYAAWESRRVDPNTLLFTPQVVGVVGRNIA